MKRRIVLILLILALQTLCVNAADDIRVTVDGKKLVSDVQPTLINGRTLIPVRSIFEALGLSVGWDPETRTVVGRKNSLEIKLTIDNDIAQRDTQFIKLDTPAMIINGRTFVPVRFIAESTGARVSWNSEMRTVEISQGNDMDILMQSKTKQTLSATEVGRKAGAVVQIYNDRYYGEDCQGSGFIISSDGKIVTNYHVIDLAKSLKIIFDDQTEYTGDVKILGYDKKRDLAIIKIEKQSLLSLQIGNSDDVEMGNDIYTIGSPLGLSNTLSEGIVSAVRGDVIQISAPISSGSSGGALLNEYGEVVGVTTAIVGDGENLGFAIPIKYVNTLDTAKAKTLLEVYQAEHEGIVVDTPVIERIEKVGEHTARLYLSNYETADSYVVSFGIYGPDKRHTDISTPEGSFHWNLTENKYIEVTELPANVDIDFVVMGHNDGIYSDYSASKSIRLGSKSQMTYDDFEMYLKHVAICFGLNKSGYDLLFDGVTLNQYNEDSIQLDYYLDAASYRLMGEEVLAEMEESVPSILAIVAQEIRDYYHKDVDAYIGITEWYDKKPPGELYSSFQEGSVIFFSQKLQMYYLNCGILWVGVHTEGDTNEYEWYWGKISDRPIE